MCLLISLLHRVVLGRHSTRGNDISSKKVSTHDTQMLRLVAQFSY